MEIKVSYQKAARTFRRLAGKSLVAGENRWQDGENVVVIVVPDGATNFDLVDMNYDVDYETSGKMGG